MINDTVRAMLNTRQLDLWLSLPSFELVSVVAFYRYFFLKSGFFHVLSTNMVAEC